MEVGSGRRAGGSMNVAVGLQKLMSGVRGHTIAGVGTRVVAASWSVANDSTEICRLNRLEFWFPSALGQRCCPPLEPRLPQEEKAAEGPCGRMTGADRPIGKMAGDDGHEAAFLPTAPTVEGRTGAGSAEDLITSHEKCRAGIAGDDCGVERDAACWDGSDTSCR
mmetsp:Transcript_122058/g.345175  ORF Transcript_122058/g.345175 Transcript_122058/m.345175 type:complete len:165 (+) Transcript_122058:692-1186(+)